VWLRRLRVFTDRRWTEPLPINTYLVGHPEGSILFDAGESPRASSRIP
jgi:N-acyl homoserine lactone hydrolase